MVDFVGMSSLPEDYVALVLGASGGLGSSVVEILRTDRRCAAVVPLSRADRFDLLDEDSIAAAACRLREERIAPRLIFDATGALTIDGVGPEKTLRVLDPAAMARQFAVNAIGPALLLKHLAPLMPRDGRSLFATLSARVGSIGDNRLGGWVSYRASKAALNQIVRTAAVETARTHPRAVVAALHPGTVATRLSEPFASGRERLEPAQSAARLLTVLDALDPRDTGCFRAYDGSSIEW